MAEVVHHLNCAKLAYVADGLGPNHCSCGAEKPETVGQEIRRSLDDVSGQEWNAASAEYRSKIQARGWRNSEAQAPGYSEADLERMNHGKAPLGPPVDSERREAPEAEVRTTSVTGGQKGVKPERFDLLPPEALAVVARHYAKGADKYGDHNWRKGYEWSKAYAALQRHLHAWWGGEDLDPETGSPHLAAVATHALNLLTWAAEHPEFDDRYHKESK